jgi:nucleoside diphosphate kinase
MNNTEKFDIEINDEGRMESENVHPSFKAIESEPNNVIEIDPKNNMVVVVKPDAYFHLPEIMDRLTSEGITITRQSTQMLPLSFVNKIMYKDLPDPIKFETAKHFSQGPSTILLLTGDENLLTKILKITGQETQPGKCDIDSIRYMFGDHDGSDMPQIGKKYFKNAIHRGKNPAEISEDLDKFKTFII